MHKKKESPQGKKGRVGGSGQGNANIASDCSCAKVASQTVQFSYGSCMRRFEWFWFRRFVPGKVLFLCQYSFNRKRQFRFRFKTVLTVPVALFGISLAIYRGQKGLSLENSDERSEKGLPGQSSKKKSKTKLEKKVENESKTSPKDPKKNLKICHFRLFFEPFLTPTPRGPGNPFSVFFYRSFRGRGLLFF